MTINKVKSVFLIFFMIGISIVLIFIAGSNGKKKNEEYETINNIADVALNSTGTIMVYLGGTTCEDCMIQSYQMRLFLSDYDLEYYYINLDGLSNSNTKKILSKLGLSEDINLPTIAIYEDGNLTVSQSGLVGTNSLYNLFKNHNLISDKKLKMNYLSITKYVEKIEEGTFTLAVGSMKSSESIEFEETLWEIVDEYNADFNFIYVSNLNKAEGNLFESKLENFSEYGVSIPSLLLVRNGKIENALIGLFTKEDYVEFLQENGIIE